MRRSGSFAAFAARVSIAICLLIPASGLAQPRVMAEQRGGPPTPDTPRILVATFRSDDRNTGIDASEAVRRRLQDQYSARDLFVVPKRMIDAALGPSGYAIDSALSAFDLVELGRQVHADEVVDAYATKSPQGVRIEARMLLKRASTILSQPLPPAVGRNAGEAAKEVEHALADARKSLPPYRNCENDLRAQKFDAAANDGRAVIQAYPGSTLGRLCLLSAFTYSKAPADSIIRVAEEILKLDSLNMLALSNGAAAYKEKGNAEKFVELGMRLWRADPLNTTTAEALIDDLVNTNQAGRAVPIADALVNTNPTEARWLRKKLAVLLAARQYKAAILFSDTLAKTDSSALTRDIYLRLGAAAALDSQPQLAAQIYTSGLKKFPNDADMWLANAQALSRSKQPKEALAAAQRAVAINPKIENGSGYLYVLGLQVQLNQLDSAKTTAAKAVEAGADKQRVAATLLAVVAPTVKKAQESKARADWETALNTARDVDAISPSPATKFYTGFAAFNIASDAANEVSELYKQLQKAKPAAQKELRTKACAAVKVVEDNLAIAQINVPPGGAYDRDSAAQIMSAMGQLAEFVSQAKTVVCR